MFVRDDPALCFIVPNQSVAAIHTSPPEETTKPDKKANLRIPVKHPPKKRASNLVLMYISKNSTP
jgi:hypothetical protein